MTSRVPPRRTRRRSTVVTDEDAPNMGPELADAVEKGIKCEIRDIFYTPVESELGKFQWVDEKPSDSGKVPAWQTRKEREAYAICKYNKRGEDDDEWGTSWIYINNGKVQSALKKVLEGYPGFTQHEMSKFMPPYLPFFHRWTEFTQYVDHESDEDVFHYLNLLRNMLLTQLEDTFTRGEEIERTGHVEWEHLDLALNPGDLAVYTSGGHRCVGVFRQGQYKDTDYGQMCFEASLDVVDWDGRRCGLLSLTVNVWQYAGLRAVTALQVSPLEAHPDRKSIETELIGRGRTFEKLRGQFFMAYSNEHDERLNERTMVDARAFYKYGPQDRYGSREKFPHYAKLSEIGRLTWAQSMNRYSSTIDDEVDMEVDLSPLTEEQCLLCVPTVRCFNIETKNWEELDLTKLHEIPWSEHAFDSLVLDEGEKDLLLALVDQEEFKHAKPFDDFISGKGQGMILLLSGPPGVGKTLTAESVAEHLRRPLYKIGAGELGITADSVETCLDTALKLCAHWHAVCLIDEADVFMEARTANNLQRNELVSVFLRLLEYYPGILILTTNRMRSLDSAFESRIDISLTYQSLAFRDRKQVWKNFLVKFDAEDVDIDDAALDRLAKWEFNGRQIKSAIKTARILAARKKEPLNAKHLDVVLTLRSKALGLMSGEDGGGGVKGVSGNGIGKAMVNGDGKA
ncbi:P-loop containing nucleoside triphosphate hydrolase protein [Massarina eburnea CBS 473.64]|uniref:P-loop containing nucleoside triphosphate hydrolase protein n=1 Tax=Massarina eburnea CBS 473.64 TaxID=1395130 RepID=A0A6A6SFW4_9PLEO|nr:P-loop containing nucleoside triphosphate hydrolase protein [Massarina eburnea CBS 473.64]